LGAGTCSKSGDRFGSQASAPPDLLRHLTMALYEKTSKSSELRHFSGIHISY
jgi:hypothetical protein